MLTIYCPVGPESRFCPSVLLDALETFALSDTVRIERTLPPRPELPSSLLLRLPSIYHLMSDGAAESESGKKTLAEKMGHEIRLAAGLGLRIVLDMGVECFFGRPETFDQLHAFVAAFALAPRQLAIASGNQVAERLYRQHCLATGFDPRVDFVPTVAGAWKFVENFVRRGEISKWNPPAAILPHHGRPRRFVSFNGKARAHRFFLCLFLHSKGWLDNAHVSLLAYDSRGQDVDLENDRNYAAMLKIIARMEMTQQLNPFLASFGAKLPLEVDVKSAEVSNPGFYATRMVEGVPESRYFDEAYVNIVTETLFFSWDSLFITEKSFKALATRNPAVFVAQHGLLRFLRSWGLRTFSPMIDESYDEVEDDLDRLAACTKEITRLAEMPESQMQQLVADCEDVFLHNFGFLSEKLAAQLRTDLARRILPLCFGAESAAGANELAWHAFANHSP